MKDSTPSDGQDGIIFLIVITFGYSIADNLVSDLVVLCEGPKDKPVLEEFFQKMGLLDRSNIKVWPLGGDIMDQLDLSVFQESHKLIALVDNDPGSAAIRKRFQKKCEELKIPVTRLKRYALENYFSIAAISAYMKGQMPAGITELASDKPVSGQLGFEVKKNGGKIAKEMKLEDLKGTDLEEFLNQVAKLATEERAKSVSGANWILKIGLSKNANGVKCVTPIVPRPSQSPAPEVRQIVAHGATVGLHAPQIIQPRTGRKNSPPLIFCRPCRGLKFFLTVHPRFHRGLLPFATPWLATEQIAGKI